MPLSFQPACLPVAHSSLPHTSPSQALAVLLKATPAVLAWPQLPRRSFREQSDVQSAIGFPGLSIDATTRQVMVDQASVGRELDRLALAYLQDDVAHSGLTADDAAGLIELLRVVGPGFKGRALKGQLIGPISLALQLTDEQRRPMVYTPMFLEGLAQHLALRAGWQTTKLADYARDIIICLDEPFLDALNSPFCPLDWQQGQELLERVFAAISGCRGLITNGAVNWSLLLPETSVELVILDAYYHASALLEASAVLPGFLERSGVLAWGLIPADEHALSLETPEMLIVRFERLLTTLGAVGVDRDKVVAASLITTSGSLGHLSVANAEKALLLCAEVSQRLRTAYGLNEGGD